MSIKELTGHLYKDPLAVLKTQYVLGWLPPREAPWIRGLGMDVLLQGGENLKLKKCGFLLSLVMVICFGIPSFASAEVKDVVRGKVGYFKGTSAKTDFYKKELKFMTDGDESTLNAIYDGGLIKNTVYFDLDDVVTVEGFTGIFTKVLDRKFVNVIYYDSNWNVLAKYTGLDSSNEIVPNVKHVAINLSKESSYELVVKDFKVTGNDGKVGNVSNLKLVPGVNKIGLTWVNPKDVDFAGVRIYQDNKVIVELDKNTTSYVVENLKVGTKYSFKVTSLSLNKGETKGVVESGKTLIPNIPPPDNVFVTPQNGKLVIAWNRVNSDDLKGYNVYIDGKKINNETLNSTKLIVDNLENGKEYSVQVSAVNSQDKEGDKSEAVIESPSKDATTIEYDLKPPLTAMEFLETCGTIVLLLSPFILVGIAVIWFKPLKNLIVKAVLDHKKKGEKK